MSIFYKTNKLQKKPASKGESPQKIKKEGNTFSVTFGGVRGKDSIKVRDFLLSHPDYPYTPKQIAISCGIGHSSAKMICLRFFQKGYIERPLSEHYQYTQKITAEELQNIQKAQNIKVHNIMLKVSHTPVTLLGVTPASVTIQKDFRQNNQQVEITVKNEKKLIQSQPLSKKQKSNILENKPADNRKSKSRNENFLIQLESGAAGIKIFTYPKNYVIYIECSESPLDVPDFMRVLGVLEGKGYSIQSAELVRWEINVDVPDLEISGANRIELRTFANAIQRLYNKGTRLREEIILRGRGAHIPMEEGVAYLRGKQTLGTINLVKTMEELEKQNEHLRNAIYKLSNVYRESLLRNDRLQAAIDELIAVVRQGKNKREGADQR